MPTASSSGGGPSPKVDFNMQKQLGADALLVRVGVLSNMDLERVVFQLVGPAKCVTDIQPTAEGEVNGTTAKFAAAAAGKALFIVVRVRAQDYPEGGGLTVNVSYSSAAGPGSSVEKLALAMPDLIRPMPLTTEVFGKNWTGLAPGEAKSLVKFPGNLTPDSLNAFLVAQCGIRVVQVIGKECIAAGTVVPANKPVLLHMGIDGAKVQMSVRSLNKGFSEVLARALAAAGAQ
jgi:hypothetical protein